jgi:hypothetical protein
LLTPSEENVVSSSISGTFVPLSRTRRQITHVLLTRAPLYSDRSPFALDLHVLGAPPTFALSQDQTLQLALCYTRINSLSLRQWPSSHHLESTRGPTRLPSDVCSSVFKDPGDFRHLPDRNLGCRRDRAYLRFRARRQLLFSAFVASSAPLTALDVLTGSASKGASYKRGLRTTQEAFFTKVLSPRDRASAPHHRNVPSPRGGRSPSSGAHRGSRAGTTTTRCCRAPRAAPRARPRDPARG